MGYGHGAAGRVERRSSWAGWTAGCAAVVLGASAALAIKPMAQVEDGYPEVKGQLEYEDTFTWDHKTPGDHGFNVWTNESEIEYGLAERFTLRVKGAYYYQRSKEFDGMRFDDAGIEGQYFFTNPNIDPVGISVIGSVLSGDNSLATEDFLVVQKDFTKWILAYNLGVVVGLDNVYGKHSADGIGTEVSLVNQGGVLYCLTPSFRFGADISAESIYFEGRRYDTTLVYAGPCVNWIPTDRIWVTTGFETELTNAEDEPRFRFTLIVGYYF